VKQHDSLRDRIRVSRGEEFTKPYKFVAQAQIAQSSVVLFSRMDSFWMEH
jgi:hypothetical protein